METSVFSLEDVEPPSERDFSSESLSKTAFASPKNERSGKIVPLKNLPIFPTSEKIRAFRKRYYREVANSDWNDWRWQLRNRITNLDALKKIIRLSDDERSAILKKEAFPPIAITPYYARLVDEHDPSHPIRRTVVPVGDEHRCSLGETNDPLGEEEDSPVAGLVHRYPDRVLLFVTSFCSTYCRYCTRSRIVGREGLFPVDVERWKKALAYIEATPTVRDVLLSGGDPLTLPDEKLEWLLQQLRKIPHVELVRIGTKVPVVLPYRITAALTRMLRRYHPLWMSIHFTHPDEITPETTKACERLADAGIPLGSQTVLLAGINDSIETIKRLFHGLLRIRVRPYYLYQCDPISGSAHFRTSVKKGLEIIKGLRGHTTGYAVPTYVIDAPGGGGKIPLLPEYMTGRDGDNIFLRNYRNKIYRYPDSDNGAVLENSDSTIRQKRKE